MAGTFKFRSLADRRTPIISVLNLKGGVGKTTLTAYLAWALALLSGSVGRGAAVGVAFGAARAVPVLAMGRVQRPDQLRRLHRGLQRWAGRAARISAATMAVVAAVAVAVGAGAAWPG